MVTDLRSDTVTKPNLKMRQAMSEAAVGDDVYGDDPTVNELEAFAANRFNKESALFFMTGTQAGLCALLSHCERGDEYICGQNSHHYKYEGGGAAVLGGIQPQPLENEPNGTIDLNKIKKAIKPVDFHFAVTKLICLENTFFGQAIKMDYASAVKKIALANKLSLHLDGARIFNAAIGLNLDVKDIASPFDSLTVCLSKGLGAPAGTMLLGSKNFINRALKWRKMCGGGLRQAGILAAAGLVALKDSPVRLINDHENAKKFAEIINGSKKTVASHTTNMVFCELSDQQLEKVQAEFKKNNILALLANQTRFVFHQDISEAMAVSAAKTLVSAL